MKQSLSVLLLCCVALVISSCSVPEGPKGTMAAKPMQPVTSIVVLPSQLDRVSRTETKDKKLRSRLEAGTVWADTVLHKDLADNPKVRFLSTSQFDDFEAGATGGFSSIIADIGRQMQSQAVLVLTMHRYNQRQGGAYAVDEPASASFDIRIYETASQRVLWSSQFDEKQQSLLSNVLTFGKAQSRGFKWITVEDLVAQGIKERLKGCPYL